MTSLTDVQSSYDAIIIGARCAGASTAMLLARRGLRVLVVERAAYGSDTLSTNALMRGGVLQLARWGVLDQVVTVGTPAVRRTTFHYDGERLEIPIASRDGVDALYAPRRTVLDRVLADAARAAGAEIVYGARLLDLLQDEDGRVIGAIVEGHPGGPRPIRAGIVIGADGMKSTVARLVGAETTYRGQHAGWVVFGYWRGLPVDGYNWHYRLGISAGVIPTNVDETLVFASGTGARFRDNGRSDTAGGYHRVIAEVSPELASDLERAERVGSYHGFAGVPGYLRRSGGPGWALVGDAGCFKDPITAHGITDALRDAELLARAVADGSEDALARYEAARNDLVRDLLETTDQIASYAWDMPTVMALHKRLSKAMNQEVKAINALGAWPVGPAVAASVGTVPQLVGAPAMEAS